MAVPSTTRTRPLRLWPGVTAAILILLGRYILPALRFEGLWVMAGFFVGLAAAVAVVIWWAFFSRAPGPERWGAVLTMIAALVVTRLLLHASIAGGMMGMMFFIYAIPLLSLSFVGWAVVSRRFANSARWATMVATIALACGVWLLLRTDGITGGGAAQLAWRWIPTPEERLLAQGANLPARAAEPAEAPAGEPAAAPVPVASEPSPPAAAIPGTVPATEKAAETSGSSDTAAPAALPAVASVAMRRPEWPGFRGAGRNSVVSGVRVDTNWAQSPPEELWRRPVGPGWSSFAVDGDVFFTQEQRGEHEVVACYRIKTGEPVWTHADAVRFWESNGGAGPRATPTLSGDGRVYTFGATGILNALDAATGARAWSRNTTADTGATVPYWGFSSSPLVIDDLVVVYAGALVAYDRMTGERRWTGEANGVSYSSPHLSTTGGVPQILQLISSGIVSVNPADGRVLWKHSWDGVTIVQPAVTSDGDILISSGGPAGGAGMRRVSATLGSGGWTSQERWTSIGLKPYFNDFVVHKGHAYGFDGSILASIDLTDGARKWKGGRYGHGQLVLLSEQDLLLVVSEEGELVLVSATPDKFTEVSRVSAIEGKTWNHPVVVGDTLLVRNGEEMVAFRLPRASR